MQPLRGTPLPDGTVALFTKIMQTHMRFVKKITQKISAYSLICNLPKPTNHVLVCMPADMQKTWMERCLKRLSIENLEVLYSFSSLGFPLAAQLRPQNQCECNAVLLALKAAYCRRSEGTTDYYIERRAGCSVPVHQTARRALAGARRPATFLQLTSGGDQTVQERCKLALGNCPPQY